MKNATRLNKPRNSVLASTCLSTDVKNRGHVDEVYTGCVVSLKDSCLTKNLLMLSGETQ